jgi:DNA-binding transcriptional ArsR family regulator
MVEHSSRPLDLVFSAVADPMRRAILEKLGRGPARVTEIARQFPVSLNAVSKHVMVLERAGLLQREVQGRDHILSIDPRPFNQAELWMSKVRQFWEVRLDALERHVIEKRRRKS